MKFAIETRDLMTVDKQYVICHCISADCAMGAGVVVPIMQKYEGVKQACVDFVSSRDEESVVGTAFRYVCDTGVVYNLFSKLSVKHKAGRGISVERYLSQLKSCLIDMKYQLLNNGENLLAMPKIACGLDGCDWFDVEKLLADVFYETDIEILVCVL